MLAPIATARIHQRFRIRILLRLCRLLESVSPLWVSVLGCAKLLQSLFLEWQPVFDSGALSARRCHLLPKRRRRETGGERSDNSETFVLSLDERLLNVSLARSARSSGVVLGNSINNSPILRCALFLIFRALSSASLFLACCA